MERIEIRQVHNREELEACFDLWKIAFPNESREFFQERIDFDSSYSFDTTWIAKVDGVIASAIQIFPYRSRLGELELLVGGIGSVATHPSYRGRGLAQEILHAQSQWMKQNDYALSLLLTGIYSFYEQVGWRKSTESIYRFNSSSVNVAALKDNVTFRHAETEDDFRAIERIYDSYNKERTNSSIRTHDFWNEQIKWRHESGDNFLLDGRHDTPTAYLRFHSRNGNLIVTEACYLDSMNQMEMLFQGLCSLFPSHGIEIRVPDDHVLNFFFQDQGFQKEVFEDCMWRIFDFTKLMKGLNTTFSQRIYQLNHVESHDVLIRCGYDAVVVSIHSNKSTSVTSLSQKCDYNERISLTEQELITLLFRGCDYVSNEKLRGNKTIKQLFPNQHSIMWSSDFF